MRWFSMKCKSYQRRICYEIDTILEIENEDAEMILER